MKSIFASITLVLASLAGTASPAHADEVDGQRAELRRAVFAKLDLTAEQKTQLKQLHERNVDKEKAMRGELHELAHQFAVALRAETSDADLRALQSRVARKREEYTGFRFEGLLEVRKLLSPDQRVRFADLYIQYRKDRAARAAGLE